MALAILLTKRGADVSIVARDEEKLKKALAQLEVFDLFYPVLTSEHPHMFSDRRLGSTLIRS